MASHVNEYDVFSSGYLVLKLGVIKEMNLPLGALIGTWIAHLHLVKLIQPDVVNLLALCYVELGRRVRRLESLDHDNLVLATTDFFCLAWQILGGELWRYKGGHFVFEGYARCVVKCSRFVKNSDSVEIFDRDRH
jgi:hypothetical protein